MFQKKSTLDIYPAEALVGSAASGQAANSCRKVFYQTVGRSVEDNGPTRRKLFNLMKASILATISLTRIEVLGSHRSKEQLIRSDDLLLIRQSFTAGRWLQLAGEGPVWGRRAGRADHGTAAGESAIIVILLDCTTSSSQTGSGDIPAPVNTLVSHFSLNLFC